MSELTTVRMSDVQVGYQDSAKAAALNSQGSIDRARGGIIKIKLTIPKLELRDSRNDRLVIPERICEFEIDLEQMPLVNVSDYAVEELQTDPDSMPYPNGVTNPYTGTFK